MQPGSRHDHCRPATSPEGSGGPATSDHATNRQRPEHQRKPRGQRNRLDRRDRESARIAERRRLLVAEIWSDEQRVAVAHRHRGAQRPVYLQGLDEIELKISRCIDTCNPIYCSSADLESQYEKISRAVSSLRERVAIIKGDTRPASILWDERCIL
jgi:hypothetical protein